MTKKGFFNFSILRMLKIFFNVDNQTSLIKLEYDCPYNFFDELTIYIKNDPRHIEPGDKKDKSCNIIVFEVDCIDEICQIYSETERQNKVVDDLANHIEEAFSLILFSCIKEKHIFKQNIIHIVAD